MSGQVSRGSADEYQAYRQTFLCPRVAARADRAAALEQPRRVLLLGERFVVGQMAGHGGETTFVTNTMKSNDFTTVINLDPLPIEMHGDARAKVTVRYRVVGAFDFNVAVDVDAAFSDFEELESIGRKR